MVYVVIKTSISRERKTPCDRDQAEGFLLIEKDSIKRKGEWVDWPYLGTGAVGER